MERNRAPLMIALSLLTLACVHSAFASDLPSQNCNRHLTETSPLSDLSSNHPAIRVLADPSRRLFQVGENSTQWELNEVAFFDAIPELNRALGLKTEGSFHIYPYNGAFYFFFIEGKKAYFLPNQSESGSPILTLDKPAIFSDPEMGSRLQERFKRPAGYAVVGYERSWNGLIVPILSPSPHLSEFRDISAYDRDDRNQQYYAEEMKRTAYQIPLQPMRYLEKLETPLTASLVRVLPPELQALLDQGITLTTRDSLPGIHPSYRVSPGEPSPYSALLVGTDDGQGRTGILQKNGIPLLSRYQGVEWVIELKGIGFGYKEPGRIVHKRDSFSIRLGRADVEQARSELKGYSIARESGLIKQPMATSTPVIGMRLPEFSNREEMFEPSDELEVHGEGGISGQAIRLAASSRRLAYTGNEAFDLPYTESIRRLHVAQITLGEQFATLRFNPPSRSSFLMNPHAQNQTLILGSLSLAPTDFSDIHPPTQDPDDFLYLELPTIEEYQVFESLENQNRFLTGVKRVLERRGLWNQRLENLFHEFKGNPDAAKENVIERLEEEVLIPLYADSTSSEGIKRYLDSKVDLSTLSEMAEAFLRISRSQSMRERSRQFTRRCAEAAVSFRKLAREASRRPNSAARQQILRQAFLEIEAVIQTLEAAP